MKFFIFFATVFTTLLLAGVGVDAGVTIGYPAPYSALSRDSSLNVEVDKANSLSSSVDVAVVISLQSCASFPNGDCYATGVQLSSRLGVVLYSGPYNPAYIQTGKYGGQPYAQVLSVHIPPSFPTGPAAMSVTHFELLGAGPFPYYEYSNIIVNIV